MNETEMFEEIQYQFPGGEVRLEENTMDGKTPKMIVVVSGSRAVSRQWRPEDLAGRHLRTFIFGIRQSLWPNPDRRPPS